MCCCHYILLCREGQFHHTPVLFKQNTLSNLEEELKCQTDILETETYPLCIMLKQNKTINIVKFIVLSCYCPKGV